MDHRVTIPFLVLAAGSAVLALAGPGAAAETVPACDDKVRGLTTCTTVTEEVSTQRYTGEASAPDGTPVWALCETVLAYRPDWQLLGYSVISSRFDTVRRTTTVTVRRGHPTTGRIHSGPTTTVTEDVRWVDTDDATGGCRYLEDDGAWAAYSLPVVASGYLDPNRDQLAGSAAGGR